MNLKPHEIKLAAKLMELASDQFSNHGCNDFELVKEAGLTPDEAYKINRDCTLANNEEWGEDELRVSHAVYGDSGVMGYLAERLAAQLDVNPNEIEIVLKIPETDFSGICVLNGISYLEKKLDTEVPDSDGYIGCRDALNVLKIILTKIDQQ